MNIAISRLYIESWKEYFSFAQVLEPLYISTYFLSRILGEEMVLPPPPPPGFYVALLWNLSELSAGADAGVGVGGASLFLLIAIPTVRSSRRIADLFFFTKVFNF